MKRKKTFSIMLTLLCITMMTTFAAADTVIIRPEGQGTYTQFSNKGCGSGQNEWQCVDEETASTSDRLQKGRNNKKETFTFQDTGLDGGDTINSVTLYFYAKRQTSRKYKMQSMIREGTTNYYGSTKSLSSNYGYVSQIYNTNPATGNAWTATEINALQAGMRTYTSKGGAKVAQVYAIVDYTPAPTQTCGNNLIEGTEVCDGTALNGATCSSQGFSGGALSCNSACTAYDTNSCWTNTCSETDYGYDWFNAGNTSGLFQGSAYSNADYCLDSTNLIEYYCAGSTHTSVTIDCSVNMTSCSAGACI